MPRAARSKAVAGPSDAPTSDLATRKRIVPLDLTDPEIRARIRQATSILSTQPEEREILDHFARLAGTSG